MIDKYFIVFKKELLLTESTILWNVWTELKKIFVDSVSEAKEKGVLSTSQRQAIIKLIEE